MARLIPFWRRGISSARTAQFAPWHPWTSIQTPSRHKSLHCESLERRDLLSGYTFQSTTIVPYPDGQMPVAGLVMDATGNLYGTTRSGGADNLGTVFEVAKGSSVVTPLASFNGINGANPQARLLIDANGNLFGTTPYGGTKWPGQPFTGDGTVFEIAKGTNAVTTLVSFDSVSGVTGIQPKTGLAMDANGNLFGTTSTGGASNGGSIFEVAHGTNAFTSLAFFGNTPGVSPTGDLLIDANGNLFGATSSDGDNTQPPPADNPSGGGTVFELAHGSTAIATLATLNGTNGGSPIGNLVFDAAGNLDGITDTGTVFQVNPMTATLMTLATPASGQIVTPRTGLFTDNSGNLFGTSFSGGGANNQGMVFEIARGASTIAMVASFDNATGFNPAAPLIQDAGGNFIGTTSIGGPTGNGTIFELPAGGSTPAVVAPLVTLGFNPRILSTDSAGDVFGLTATGNAFVGQTAFEIPAGASAARPILSFDSVNHAGLNPNLGAVVFDSAGNLFGATGSALFEVPLGSTTMTTLATFPAGVGANNLTIDANGNLFGATPEGGNSNTGTAFELPQGSNALTTLASFNLATGTPIAATTFVDANGNLYGQAAVTTPAAATVIYEVAKGSSTVTTLASFASGVNPSIPILDSNGNLFGTTDTGGPAADGTIFEIDHATHALTTLARFNGFNGSHPFSLSLDANGNLYGLTSAGGDNGAGTVFSLPHGFGFPATLLSFGNGNGLAPAGLVADAAGDVFGTTAGTSGTFGTLFEIVHGSGALTLLKTFNGPDGLTPGPLLQDSSGNLFGATQTGGATAANGGTVFELSPPLSATISAPPVMTPGTTSESIAVTYTDVNPIDFSTIKASNLTVTGPDGTPLTVTPGNSTTIGHSTTVTYTAAAPGGSWQLSNNGTYTIVLGANTVMDTAGNGNHAASTMFIVQTRTAAQVALTASTATAIPAQAVFFTATVTAPGGGTPSGVVTFYSDGSPIGTATLNANGVATLSTTTLAPGSHAITASYGGDAQFFAPSPSAALTETISGASALQFTLSGKLPTSVVAGQKAHISQTLKLTNPGGVTLNGPTTASLFLSPDSALDANAIALPGTFSKKIKLKTGKHASEMLKLKSLPATVPAGVYHLLVQVVDPVGGASVVASTGTITVLAAQIDLAGMFTKVPSSAKSGKPVNATLLINNNGTTSADGTLQIALSSSTTNTLDSSAVPIKTISIPLHLAAHKLKIIHLGRLMLPAQAGSYFIIARLDPANVFGNVNLANNVILSATAVTVA